MCTIALAKVQRNYNCYNVYFYECLRLSAAHGEISRDVSTTLDMTGGRST